MAYRRPSENTSFQQENESLFKMVNLLESPSTESSHNISAAQPLPQKPRHPVMTVMLLTFAVLLLSAAVLICLDIHPDTEPIPEDSVSLCAAESGRYLLGIEGDALAVYYNGKIERLIHYPVYQLSDYDKQLLSSGISFSDESALKKALEDYTS